MNKEMLDSWIAKAGEHKIAIGVAAACTIVILGSLLWPTPKPQAPISAVKTATPSTPVFTPKTPAPQPAPAAQSAPAVQQAAPASSPAPSAPSTMQQELEAKPLFPSSSQPSTPKPAAQPAPKPAPPAPRPAPTAKPSKPAHAPAPAATPATPTPASSAPAAQLRPVPVASIPAGYYVQLGSFKSQKGAAELAKKAASKHWSSYVAPRPNDLHAVWIGPYRTRPEADKAKLQLHKDMGISGFVVQSH